MVLGLDVGFACLGWALFVDDRLDMLGVIVTEKGEDESASGGLIRRCHEMRTALDNLDWSFAVDRVVMESVSWPRSGSVIGKMGAAYGVVGSMCGAWGVPQQVSPQALRKALGLAKGSDKDAILTAVREAPGCERLDELLADIRTKALRRHPTDAAAVVLAARALQHAVSDDLCG